MAKARYRFNRESLSYTEVRRGVRFYLQLALRYALASVALSVICYVVFSLFSETPRERQLSADNAEIDRQLQELNERYAQLTAVLQDIEQRDNNIYRLIFESEPVPSDEREVERTIDSLYREVVAEGCGRIASRTGMLLASLSGRSLANAALFDVLMEKAGEATSLLGGLPAILPVGREVPLRIAAPFAVRIHPFYKVLKMHTGIDFAAPVGTSVLATANGVVQEIRASLRGHGNTVVLVHGGGYSTQYSHLERVLVRSGQQVTRGMQIATVGNTGMSMAPHLHYEVQKDGVAVDPLNYLFLEQGPVALAELARAASQTGQSLD